MTFSLSTKQILSAFSSAKLRKNFFIVFVLNMILIPGELCAFERDGFDNPDYTSSNIKTVRFHRLGEPMSYPVIGLNSNQKLFLSFDETGTTIRDFYYSIEFCNSDWQPSRLMKTEYFKGADRIPIQDYSRSYNTTFDYVHYQLNFPNKEASILLSGNYLLRVYQNYDDEKPVIVRRFMVSEQKARIEASINYPMQSRERGSFQEIDFEVFYSGVSIQNPSREVTATVMQNNRTDNAFSGLSPMFVGEDYLDFKFNRKIVFEGGNEFRWIDLRSLRFQSDHVADINFHDPFYHVDVFTDKSRSDQPYRFHRDYNGQFFIDVQEEQDPAVSSDYAFVHFSVEGEPPLNDRKVYLMGGLSNWQFNEQNQLNYDYDQEVYTLTLLLKQGYYDYQYLVKDVDDTHGSVMPLEGSFGRTENNYLIMIYYRRAGDRYDRLLGTATLNSLKR